MRIFSESHHPLIVRLMYKRTFEGGTVHHRDELTEFLGFTRTMEN
jgi:hypothetical protein